MSTKYIGWGFLLWKKTHILIMGNRAGDSIWDKYLIIGIIKRQEGVL